MRNFDSFWFVENVNSVGFEIILQFLGVDFLLFDQPFTIYFIDISLLLDYSFGFGVAYLQILEGLLKHPENRECADCKTKYGFVADVELSALCWFVYIFMANTIPFSLQRSKMGKC